MNNPKKTNWQVLITFSIPFIIFLVVMSGFIYEKIIKRSLGQKIENIQQN
jgi:F0F1-type ATP synthase membrane subunit b/b'